MSTTVLNRTIEDTDDATFFVERYLAEKGDYPHELKSDVIAALMDAWFYTNGNTFHGSYATRNEWGKRYALWTGLITGNLDEDYTLRDCRITETGMRVIKQLFWTFGTETPEPPYEPVTGALRSTLQLIETIAAKYSVQHRQHSGILKQIASVARAALNYRIS